MKTILKDPNLFSQKSNNKTFIRSRTIPEPIIVSEPQQSIYVSGFTTTHISYGVYSCYPGFCGYTGSSGLTGHASSSELHTTTIPIATTYNSAITTAHNNTMTSFLIEQQKYRSRKKKPKKWYKFWQY